jgi:Fe2+ or Zn2+ uptake regulation protein
VQERRELIRRLLQGRGLKATPQRLVVLEAIDSASGYFTPQELYERLRAKRPGIGLVTVYRTLNALTGAGLVCEIESPGKAHRYVQRKPLAHHHHLVCETCARVVDFGDCDLSELAGRLSRETGFEIRGHSLEFHGRCPACTSRGKP